MIAFRVHQILTQAVKTPDILANFKPPIEAANNPLETQQCDHFQGTLDPSQGSQKTGHFG